MSRTGVGTAAALACLLAGCTVGPKYKVPDVPVTPAFKELEGWKTAQPSDQVLRGTWWELFADPQLTALEVQVPTGNQNLKGLEARFREARAAIRFNRASEFPTISTSPSIASVRASSNQPYLPPGAAHATGDFVLPFDVSYELDFWGRVRRTVASSARICPGQRRRPRNGEAQPARGTRIRLLRAEKRGRAEAEILDNTVRELRCGR